MYLFQSSITTITADELSESHVQSTGKLIDTCKPRNIVKEIKNCLSSSHSFINLFLSELNTNLLDNRYHLILTFIYFPGEQKRSSLQRRTSSSLKTELNFS